MFFMIGILALFFCFQSVEFNAVFGLVPYFTDSFFVFGNIVVAPLSVIGLLLFLGAMGKSAQIGLHTWLPDAMEGPTPVSALIHAATMVTAGVFLIIRCSPLFECAPDVLLFITFIGAGTAFMAATSGLVQNDLKKVIAYSTCSQLGYMVFACGLSSYSLGLFHLANHAFFKALLFLSAGAVIHSVSSEQDLRKFGAFVRILPYTYVMFLIGSLALMGFPFLTGFYSKDIILEVAGGTLSLPGTFAYWLGLVTAFFTAFYSFRLLYLTFYGTARSYKTYLIAVHELTPRMAFSLAVLSVGSIFLGYFARDLFIGFGTPFWNGTIYFDTARTSAQLIGEFLPFSIKIIPFAGSMLSVGAVFLLNYGTISEILHHLYTAKTYRGPFRFLSHKWYFDTFYNRLVNQPLLEVSYRVVFALLDKGLFEFCGPTGTVNNIRTAGTSLIEDWHTGLLFDYIFFMLGAAYVYQAFSSLLLPKVSWN
jgi:NADH-ubiquinone oxidoreductase chain 5